MPPPNGLLSPQLTDVSRKHIPLCPRDHGGLKAYRAKEFDVLQCEQCGGLWLPANTVAVALGRAGPSVRTVSRASRITCPDQGAALISVRSHGVEIDVCPGCGGVWLDRGELERVLTRKRLGAATRGSLEVASYAPDVAVEGVAELGGVAIELVVEVVVGVLSGW